ncbi:hypothetical protein KY290_036444 [Solanum tuberosum]|uniref:Reverse transcriptase/retrotransposon-derived protein RNase H-like domain-containing protein n=1 Tax=Solanum tuberosum TaxID=4113 RepID=A0ABQ7TSN6_SOLTU|nr:hypothetical protein KY290_036444 [Solanum tuberosum]
MKAFETLQQVMIQAPVLALQDFSKSVVVEVDACGSELGVVLMQEGRPLTYLSKGLTKLLGLSYEIQYKKRVENIAAAALSRRFEKEAGCKSISVVLSLWVQEVLRRYEEDIEIAKLLSQLLLHDKAVPNMSLQQGILRYKGQIWVGSSGNLRQQLVEAMDITTWGGYSGVYATQQRLKSLALSS